MWQAAGQNKRWKKIVWYMAVTVFALAMIFPFLWMLSTALKSNAEVFSLQPTLIPEQVTLQSFTDVLAMPELRRYMLNSLIVALTTTFVCVSLACLAGYGFSRLRFKGRRILLGSILSAQMIPGVILLVPIFLLMAQFRLLDSYTGLVLSYVTFALPFSTWIMTGFYKRIPREMEEAAMMDGANRFQAFWKIILPLSKPGLMSTSIFCFIVTWDEFLFALTLTRSEEMRTLPYGLYSFMDQYSAQWNNMMAASAMAIIPPLIIFILLQRHFMRGFSTGAVKDE